MGTEEKNI